VVFENRDAAGKGQLFDAAIADPEGVVQGTTRRVCEILYRDAAEVHEDHHCPG
jgi:hypothetical protein